MADQSKCNKLFCPFWDKFGKRSCRLIESGLFIPTREHIFRFCENRLYVKCYHYKGKPAVEDQFSRNRRQFNRIPTSQKLSLSRYSIAKDAYEDMLDSDAMTVDLSLGGIRIETNEPVYVNQIISFTFDENFHPPGFEGKGEVRWINNDKSQDTPSNAGLAFVDDDTKNTVKNHLLGMGDKLLRLSGF